MHLIVYILNAIEIFNVFNLQLVTKDIVLQNYECPLCIELRAAALQSVFGCAFPAVLTHVGALAVSEILFTSFILQSLQAEIQLLL